MASVKKKSKSSSLSSIKPARKRTFRYAICVNNDGYPASLERGKLYSVIPDRSAAAHGYLRIVDESGEDYAYAAQRFFGVTIPRNLAIVLTNSRPAPSVR